MLERDKMNNFKIQFVVDKIMGRCWSTAAGIRYEDGLWMCENDIRDLANDLIKFSDTTRDSYWITCLSTTPIRNIISKYRWENHGTVYSFDEAEKMQIINLCIRQIKLRMENYIGTGSIQYRIWDNGDVGLRYIAP